LPGRRRRRCWRRRGFPAQLLRFDLAVHARRPRQALYQPAGGAARLAGIDSYRVSRSPGSTRRQHFDRINQALYLDMQLLLSGNNLVKPDRMGMAVSIEARTPFLDWRMMEFAFRSRGTTKLRDGDKKHWYKKAAAPLIGDDLAYRRKADVHRAGGRMVPP
jgi:asparagine synthase (glutamine-hydrolysing)